MQPQPQLHRPALSSKSPPPSGPMQPIQPMQLTQPVLALLPALMAALPLLVAAGAQAQLLPNMAAPTEQRPVLLRTANGLPQIDITRPGASGVSVNQFRQFDIDPQGAVINNGRKASQTALAGWVAANPALVAGEAKLIVNEVRSSDPTLLRGYLEIAGGKAELIIANPAGISCAGCGFIHASRVTLATARPEITEGKLTGYAAGSGVLEIAGRGLDGSRVDALSLLTQAARVNAGIWARELTLELTAAAETTEPTNTTMLPSVPPYFALDVASVGGMYANRIWLIGTAHGLGVRNAGQWSAVESLTVSIDGKLDNRASIDARRLTIRATAIDNTAHGKLLGEQLALQADRIANTGHPDASPVIAAAADLDIGTRLLANTDQATLFAGADLRIGRELDDQAHATGKAELVLNRFANIEALGKLSLHTRQLQNLNQGVTISEEQIGESVRKSYLQPDGQSEKYTKDHFVWTPWSRAGQYRWVTDKTRLTEGIPGQTPLPDVDGIDCTEAGGVEHCTSTPGSAYPSDDPAWAYFKLAPPDLPPPLPGPEPRPPAVDKPAPYEPSASPEEKLAWTKANASYEIAMAEYQLARQSHGMAVQAYDEWTANRSQRRAALNDAISAYNAGFGNINIRGWTQYEVDRSEYQSRVVSSAPGRITAGGEMTLAGDDLVNDRSQIIAGGKLIVELQNLRNIDAMGTHRVHESGTSQYSRSAYRGWLRNYHTRVWGPVLPYAPADQLTSLRLPVTVATGEQAGQLPPADVAVNVAAGRLLTDGSSLLRSNLSAGPLFVTDPRFTVYRQWLSSDAMLNQLAVDPERMQKRIGDGYIEQRLVREQIAQLTGRRYLPGQANDEAQFAALMKSGVHQARELQLTPGIALSAAQVDQLTADMVWLVEQEITLPASEGQPERKIAALVPRVYLLPRTGDLDVDSAGGGALISARRITMAVSDALDNAGTIAGADGVQLSARVIRNSGAVAGDTALLVASEDIDIRGGTVLTRHDQQLLAGGDIVVGSTSRDSTQPAANPLVKPPASHAAMPTATPAATSESSRTGIDRVARLHVAGDGRLKLLAGRDIVLDAAQLRQAGSGEVSVIAGQDLVLGTVATQSSTTASARQSANHLRESQRMETGTVIEARGAVVLGAGQDLAARAAHIESGSSTTLSAGRDLEITAGEAGVSFAQGTQFRHSGLFGSTTSTRRTVSERTEALASTVSGSTVTLSAGRDLKVAGSDVSGDRALHLQAGRDIDLTAATETARRESFSRDTRSGLLSGPGLSIGIGSQQQQHTSEGRSTRQRGSQVGTLAGDVRIDAGDSYRQQASKVIAPTGSAAIKAGNIDIAGGTDTSDSKQASSFSQSGLSITLSNPLIDAGRSLESLNNASKATHSSRAQMLAAAAAGLTVADTAKQVAKDPTHGGGVTLAVTLGSSKSESTATQHATRVAPSFVAAGGNVEIRAKGRPDSRLALTGSQIVAADTVALKSDGELVLEAQINTDTQSMSSHSSSAGIGLAASLGKEGMGLGIIANAGKAKGKAAGDEGSWTNTEVTAGRRASLRSKGDSRVKGAIVKAPTIDARIGGDLLIQSLQDSSRYESHQQSLGGSFTLPLTGGGSPSAQFNASKSAIHSNYLSTNEASGLQAGDGGFQVQVTGKAELQGAAIASTDAAVNARTNHFSSAELAMSDLNNLADYDARATGVGIGVGPNPQGKYAPKGNNAGLGSDSGHQRSVTTAGISGIAGNSEVRTGDAPTGLNKIFDAERVAKKINAQVTISQEFSGQAYKLVDDFVDTNSKTLKRKIDESRDEMEKQRLNEELAMVRRSGQVINILIGTAIGYGGAVTTKEALSSAAENMRVLMIEDSERFKGITDGVTTISNTSGNSTGVRNDGEKLGGTRIDEDTLCGKQYYRCKIVATEAGAPILDANGKIQFILDADGRVQFDPVAAKSTLQAFLESDEGQKMRGITGGVQGVKGTLFGIPYEAGSWQDHLIEAFAGTHDYVSGKLLGLYDSRGNLKQGMTQQERDTADRLSAVAVVPSAPFAMAELLPPAVWSAISILLKNAP